MGKISKIEVCKKNKNRVNIYVDDSFFHAVFDEVCAKNKLAEGKEIDEKKLLKILSEEEQQKCDMASVKYLSKFLKTTKELKKYLQKKGFEENVAKNSIKKCVDYGYLNDENFTKSYINAKKNTCSSKQIAFELSKKGIKNAEINKENDLFAIKNLAEKNFRKKEANFENLTKFKANLFRKGFKFEDINTALAEFGGESESWN